VLVIKYHSTGWGNLSLHPRLYNFLYLTGILLFIFPPFVIFVLYGLGQYVGNVYISYAERISPLISLISITGLEWCAWHIAVKKLDFSMFRRILATTLKILLLALPIIVIPFITKWGLSSSTRDGAFGNPPTPLLEWQIVLVILIGSVVMMFEQRWKIRRLDSLLFFLVYISACFIWLADPLEPGAFATIPRAPNFEPYPFSDPQIYAQYSQSALAGHGFLWPDIPTRPFYVMLLTWMYAIMGQNYYHVIALQMVLLAFFPAVLYLLGREFGSRSLGISLAILAILRDLTTNHSAGFALNYSYSKLFLSELPAGLFLVIFTILVIKWIRYPKPIWFFLLMGCVLGVASLIRLQSVVVLLPVAIVTIFPLWESRRIEWLKGMIFITMGIILAMLPWMVRNYVAADGFVIDNPVSQSMVLARRWNGDNDASFPRLPGETAAEYVNRMNGITIDSFKRDPGRILNSVANHFFNNIISSLYTFPVRDHIGSFAELFWPKHAFWQTGIHLSLLTIFYIIFMAVGLAVAWITNRWVGLLPFILSFGYNAWTALFLSSGDRFLIPIDWTWHLYFILGLLTISKAALSGIHDLGWNPLNTVIQASFHHPTYDWKKTITTAGLVLCVGLLLPLTEHVFPEKYPALTQGQLSSALGIVPREGEIIVYGRAIYPRYYDAEDGEPGTAKVGYEVSDDARLVFWLVGSDPKLVILPLESAPPFFPHASDVWIIGKAEGDFFYARMVEVKFGGRDDIYGE